jgi:calcineurin-like phosphoesterase family protein
MNTYVTSDLHFFHKNILEFCHQSRPYSSVDDMHEAIVHNWNTEVQDDDLTYILGDVTFGKISLTIDLLRRLNGRKILIKGNHDKDAVRKAAFCDCFESIHDYLEIKQNGTHVVLMHFPIMLWNLKHHGAVHLHGHLHGNPSGVTGRIKDVGMDSNFCKPHLLDDVIHELLMIPLDFDHHGRTIQ